MTAPFKPETVLLGLCLVALGLVWTLDNLGRVDMLSVLRTYWPATLITWGFLELAAWGLARRTR